MKNRLMEILKDIWSNDIYECYINGLICSERLLQAEIYHQLKNQSDYQVWIEPELELKGLGLHHKKPDIIITDCKSVIGVLEIKFNLEKGIDIEWDIDKLIQFSLLKGCKKIPLLTDLKNGDWDKSQDKSYSISKDLVLAFAIIAWKGTNALNSKMWPEKIWDKIPDNFYHLIGIVDDKIRRNQIKRFYTEIVKSSKT